MPIQLNTAARQHVDKVVSDQWGLYFHGTGREFDAFDDRQIGSGRDANSSLGFFVTSNPVKALGYAVQAAGPDVNHGRVLLVLVNETQNYEFGSFAEFYGADWPDSSHPQRDAEQFMQLRAALIEAGHTAAWNTLGDEGSEGAVLKASDILVLASLTLNQAHVLTQAPLFREHVDGVSFDDKRRLITAVAQALGTVELEPA